MTDIKQTINVNLFLSLPVINPKINCFFSPQSNLHLVWGAPCLMARLKREHCDSGDRS